jgi:LPS-assembly lipoprotein
MNIQRVRFLSLLIASLALGACGFHLQGRQALPPVFASTYVDSVDAQSDFTQALRAALTASGAKLMVSAAADSARVRILKDETNERVLTVSSRNIPTDYELSYEVEVSVSAGGRELMTAERFSLTRVYSFDETRLLAKEREKEILQEALARDMASVVARRLASL